LLPFNRRSRPGSDIRCPDYVASKLPAAPAGAGWRTASLRWTGRRRPRWL